MGCAATGRTSNLDGTACRRSYEGERDGRLDTLTRRVTQTVVGKKVAWSSEQPQGRLFKRGTSVEFAIDVDKYT